MPDATDVPPSDRVGITREQVAHLARLSRLALDDAELDGLAAELDIILGAVAAIGEVTDAADVPPTTHAVPVENVTRPDVVTPSLPREKVLAGAPEAEDGRFRVPRILDEEV
jgi:aspartyl-tRNA(Asn)/glutamyl-tRNA(Gln) amidotransferase subunit C